MLGEAAQRELVEPLELVLVARLPHREDDRDGVRAEPARDEGERLHRGAIEPLRVVHDAEQGPLLRDAAEQGQHGEADQEAIGRVAAAQPERRAEGVALRIRQALEAVQPRRAELVQAGERELHLGLDARSPPDAAARGPRQQVLQQRRLADAGLAPDQQHPAVAGANGGHDVVEHGAFRAPTTERRTERGTSIGHLLRRS